jgi:quercetin dioxygenase-like cupin family protein
VEEPLKPTDTIPNGALFPKGEKIAGERIANDHFIGNVWLQMLVPDDNTFYCPVGNVTFEPGARNSWHTHPGGQILLVTGGRGYSQDEGGEVRLLRAGDVVTVAPGVKHWHGAARDSWFSHIAIMPDSEKGDAQWYGPVTDEEYNNLENKKP